VTSSAGADPGVRTTVARYLRTADRLLDAPVVGLYVVGSAALGGWRPGRSDIDAVAVLGDGNGEPSLARLRMVHVATAARTGLPAVARGHLTFPGTCNVVYVRAGDLTRPVTEIVPVASHTGHRFRARAGFDVNPVTWMVLAGRGIAIRGPEPATLGLDPQPELLRAWNLANLDTYWRRWADRVTGRGAPAARLRSRWQAAWGALGAPRLHCTIATGEVITKEQAGDYALATFADEWHPIVHEALAYRQGDPGLGAVPTARARVEQAAAFVCEVVRCAHDL
jgi:hypothetical protein